MPWSCGRAAGEAARRRQQRLSHVFCVLRGQNPLPRPEQISQRLCLCARGVLGRGLAGLLLTARCCLLCVARAAASSRACLIPVHLLITC